MAEYAAEQKRIEEIQGVTFHPQINHSYIKDDKPVFERLYTQGKLQQQHLEQVCQTGYDNSIY